MRNRGLLKKLFVNLIYIIDLNISKSIMIFFGPKKQSDDYYTLTC